MSRFSSDRYRLVDRFDSSYWSGKDVQVFAEDILIDDALQVSFQVMEQVRPYYHYSHYEVTRMHHGTRTITGELSLNFKRSGYLYSLLNYLRQKDPEASNLRRTLETPAGAESFEQERPVVPFANAEWGPIGLAQTQSLSPSELRRVLDQQKRISAENTKWIEQGEAAKRFSPVVPTSRGVFETRFGGFDLNIIYGANVEGGHVLRYFDDDDYTIGHSAAELSFQPQVGTGVKIIGVELMGSSNMIDDSGRPLTETYAFMAKSFQILRASELKQKE